MAKAPASDTIMTPDKMKPLLALSKKEPVQAAIGLTTDGEGLILLHKKAKPKKVLSMLRAEAGKAKLQLNTSSMRFGRAEVDTDYDSAMVRFFINKDAPGNMRVKLVEVVKRIPYQKVEINVDPSLEDEPEDEQEGQEASRAEAPPQAASAPPPPPAPAAPSPEAAALARDIAALAGAIAKAAQNNPAQRASLVQLAGEANAKLKSGDLAGTAQSIAALRAALEAAAQPAAAAALPDAAALRKELATLIGGIAQAAGDDPARRAALAKLANDANAALKADDAGTAAGLVAQLRDALAAPASAAQPSAELQARLDVCREDLAQIRDAAVRASITQSIQEITALLQGGKAGPAASLLDVLETQIAEAIRAARQSGVAQDAGSLVDFAKLLLRWRDAQRIFDTNLQAIGDALLKHPEIQSDPRLGTIREGIAKFPTLVPKFGGNLEAALDSGMSAAEPAEKARHAAEASSAIDAYRQEIAAASKLAELEKFAAQDLGARLPLQAALDQALVELKQQLAGRA